MNRTEFMRQLERLLQNLPSAEREEALQYYNDYFDDAGVENEREVIDALGNPAKVAENIKRDLYGESSAQSASVKNPPASVQGEESEEQGYYYRAEADTKSEGGLFQRFGAWFQSLPTWGKVLAIIAGFILAPVLFGIISSVFGAVVSLITGWFSLILGFGVTAVALFIVLIILLATGFMCLFQAPMGGVALIGVGLLCGGIGVLFMMLTVAMAGIATPAIFKGIAKLCKHIFGKKEVAA